MALVPVTKPYSLKTATAVFKIVGEAATSDFSSHISEVTFTPSTSSSTWTAINGNVISDGSIATWAAGLGLVQDLDAAGFMRWLLDNEGKRAEALFTFADGTDPCKIMLTLQPSNIGGAANGNVAEASVTLPCDGKPVFDAGATLDGEAAAAAFDSE